MTDKFTKKARVGKWEVFIAPDEYRGYFEHDEYGEGGGLWFTNGWVADYDGVYFLPKDVAAAIRSLGYIVPEDCLL